MTKETRIDRRFAKLKRDGRPGLVTFITAGDPDLETSKTDFARLAAGWRRHHRARHAVLRPDGRRSGHSGGVAAGAACRPEDARHAGDGRRVPQRRTRTRPSCSWATTTRSTFILAKLSSLDALAAGVDGLIVVDLPPEADDELCLPATEAGLNFIRLATPTTDAKRLPAVLSNTSGFLYYVSITGITGSAAPNVNNVHMQVRRIKESTALPVAVGFGVKSPDQAKALGEVADAVVVGSALVGAIEKSLGADGRSTSKTVPAVLDLVGSLAAALRAA